MIRQRLIFAGLLVAVVSIVASSGDVEARNRCQRGYRQSNRVWGVNNGYAQATYMTTPAVQPAQPAATPTIAPDPNAPTPPAQAPAPAPTAQSSSEPTT